jgi:hypothetical protein
VFPGWAIGLPVCLAATVGSASGCSSEGGGDYPIYPDGQGASMPGQVGGSFSGASEVAKPAGADNGADCNFCHRGADTLVVP